MRPRVATSGLKSQRESGGEAGCRTECGSPESVGTSAFAVRTPDPDAYNRDNTKQSLREA